MRMRRRSARLEMKRRKVTEVLPDDIWLKIFEIGIENMILTHKDLSFLSVSCKYFNQLSNQETLWSTLLALDFPQEDQPELAPPPPLQSSDSSSSSSSSSMKELYKDILKDHIASIHQVRTESASITKELKELRGELMKRKQILKEIEELTDVEEAWYHALFEEFDMTEKRNMGIKKRVSKLHAYYKKKYGNFYTSNAACLLDENSKLS